MSVAVILLVTGAAGCEAKHGTSAHPIGVATMSADGGATNSSLTGTLGASRTGSTGCFWVDIGDGRRAVIWPRDWTAETNPLRILDGHGHVVATVGDHVSLRGSDVQSGSAQYCRLVTDPFLASELTK